MYIANDENDFVELSRTFNELPKDRTDLSNLDWDWQFGISGRIQWSQLEHEYRTVILSEAGSGKTEEIRHFATTMRAKGEAAFFLRLEHVANDFDDALEVGSIAEFERWINSTNEGWLLLDSVDEARLRSPNDFTLAIAKIANRIADALQRAHIVITGRATAWRPKTDLELCNTRLPYHPRSQLIVDAPADNTPSIAVTSPEPCERPTFKIFTLSNLNHDQVRAFASAKGVVDADQFLDAIERADAWSFAARPQDLQELVEFWKHHGQIGSRLDIMQNSIQRRLSERDQSRADAKPLSLADAREGAQIVAAAVTLMGDSTIQIPDGANNAKGIAVEELLPHWDDADKSALLARPIFTEAIYGTVRFHHRSVREYLTAEWLAQLLKRHTSRRDIDSLIFRQQYGLRVVVPALRPILPWLVILDSRSLDTVMDLAPEVLLEGGDPGRLPADVRETILTQICEAVIAGKQCVTDYASAQRFANHDIADTIRTLLRQYTNDDVQSFLLRMVWLGQIKEALPEAMAIALRPESKKYTRIAAIRAVQAIGQDTDLDLIRECFLSESANLNPDLLTELLVRLNPTRSSVEWILACVEKIQPSDRYSTSKLSDAIKDFITLANADLHHTLARGLNALLSKPPVRERYFCEVSQQYEWLIDAAVCVILRLIESRHHASLETSALELLSKMSVTTAHWHGRLETDGDVRTSLASLVQGWPELNRALFWHEASRTKRRLKEAATYYWQVSAFGALWHFSGSDFDYLLEQIVSCNAPNKKQLALSLALAAFDERGRNSQDLQRLRNACKANDILTNHLNLFLAPARRRPSKWEKQAKARQKQIEEQNALRANDYELWRSKLRTNPDAIRNNGLKPGQLSKDQLHLYHICGEKNPSNEWTNGNWKCLIDDFGEDVAQAYRDGAVGFWRTYKPQLYSEGASQNSTPYAVLFGLTGLQIEATETPNGLSHLNAAETDLAFRYACHELDGFPNWLPALFSKSHKILSQLLLQEVRFQIASEKPGVNSYGLLGSLSWSGQWAWEHLAPELLKICKSKEPTNLTSLTQILTIIQGSTLSDADIARLAARKCRSLKRFHHLTYWLAVWMGVDPDRAIVELEAQLNVSPRAEELAASFVTNLVGNRGRPTGMRLAYRNPETLSALYLLLHRHLRSRGATDRSGEAFSTMRDEAQEACESLVEILRHIPGKKTFIALQDIARCHPKHTYKPWFERRAQERAEKDADLGPWTARNVRSFNDKIQHIPTCHRDLAELAYLRLLDLKDDLENGDSSIAKILMAAEYETDVRKFVGSFLREQAFGRYSIPQEEELADGRKPDLRFHGAGFDAPVPCELKLAGRWSAEELFERLENQLCGDYLRDNRSRYGIFLLVHNGKGSKSWKVPGKNQRVDFTGLIDALNARWRAIADRYPNIDSIEVVEIDLTLRFETPRRSNARSAIAGGALNRNKAVRKN